MCAYMRIWIYIHQSFQLCALVEFSGPDRLLFEVDNALRFDNGRRSSYYHFLRVAQLFHYPSPVCMPSCPCYDLTERIVSFPVGQLP